MGTANGSATAPVADSSSDHRAGRDSASRLGGWRGFILALTTAAAAAALALGQHWLVVTDLVPLLIVVPCAVMMFTCMKSMNHGQQTDTTRIAANRETPPVTDSQN